LCNVDADNAKTAADQESRERYASTRHVPVEVIIDPEEANVEADQINDEDELALAAVKVTATTWLQKQYVEDLAFTDGKYKREWHHIMRMRMRARLHSIWHLAKATRPMMSQEAIDSYEQDREEDMSLFRPPCSSGERGYLLKEDESMPKTVCSADPRPGNRTARKKDTQTQRARQDANVARNRAAQGKPVFEVKWQKKKRERLEAAQPRAPHEINRSARERSEASSSAGHQIPERGRTVNEWQGTGWRHCYQIPETDRTVNKWQGTGWQNWS
jgi:hypothetical protein